MRGGRSYKSAEPTRNPSSFTVSQNIPVTRLQRCNALAIWNARTPASPPITTVAPDADSIWRCGQDSRFSPDHVYLRVPSSRTRCGGGGRAFCPPSQTLRPQSRIRTSRHREAPKSDSTRLPIEARTAPNSNPLPRSAESSTPLRKVASRFTWAERRLAWLGVVGIE
jgi:hypothetical protein